MAISETFVHTIFYYLYYLNTILLNDHSESIKYIIRRIIIKNIQHIIDCRLDIKTLFKDILIMCCSYSDNKYIRTSKKVKIDISMSLKILLKNKLKYY